MLTLVASTQGLLFVQMSWQVNQGWIAATLCVNRARPELHCDGACQLAERLAAQQKRYDESRTVRLEVVLCLTAHILSRLAGAVASTATAALDAPCRRCRSGPGRGGGEAARRPVRPCDAEGSPVISLPRLR